DGELRAILARVCAGERFAAVLEGECAGRAIFTRYERDRLDGQTDFEGAWFDRAAAEADQAASPQNANYHTWKLFVREERVADLAAMRPRDRRKALRFLLERLVARFPGDIVPAGGLIPVTLGSWHRDRPAFLAPAAGRVVFTELHEPDGGEEESGRIPFAVPGDGRRGFVDLDGRVLVLGAWEKVEGFHGGLAAVRQGGSWGLLRRDGTVHQAPRWEAIGSFHQGLAKVREGGLWGVIDADGAPLVPCAYEVLELDHSDGIAYAGRDGRYGLIRVDGPPIVDFGVEDPAIRFGPGVPFGLGRGVWRVSAEGLLAACRVAGDGTGRWGFIHVSGRVAVPFDYDDVMYFEDGLAVVERDGLRGCVDARGEVVIPLAAHRRYGFSEGLMAVSATAEIGSRWGYMDRSGRLAIGFDYDSAERFSEGLARVGVGGYPQRWRHGFVDPAGTLVIPWRQGGFRDFHEGLAGAEFERKWGFVDRRGKSVIGYRHDEVDDFRGGVARVKRDGKWGLIDRGGKVTVPLEQDWIFYPAEELVCARREKKWGYLDPAGRVVAPFDYDEARPFRNGRALVARDGRAFFLKREALR
ncbi:MAG: WG repeat-containing protein, partial [Alphaproteobacteria bacterium]|nr:WG repeat-containing protein [Alphaproteobacteria bacterium]